ncbi:secreted hydrolase [Trichoderma arundinaceum]|uniref:Secreted hydrolase n=1 Tax=Trichoderma arundinaceum TaxID=490622 RepID=A0A395NNJ4_TRIAR|nr:secreted hydrolase [Trichoderma arundinaceum]
MATSSGSITTFDGITLRYIAAGNTSDPVLLLIPGWVQTAIQWRKQISYFSAKYRVIAIDHRGHGDSDKPDRGYRLSRLAADLHEVITQLDLKNIILCGHSMGCSVIWAYWDSFAASRSRISRLILVDQSPCMTKDPAWKEGIAESLGAILTPSMAFEMGSSLCGSGGNEYATGFLRTLFSPSLSTEDFEWTMQQCSKISLAHAATLLVNHASQDWRDVIPTITVPTLVVGAEGSVFRAHCSRWIASQIQGGRVEIFEEDEGGSHFMFWENEAKFNKVVEEFLQD